MSRLKALLQDVDGVLAESERDGHLVAYNRAFKACGLPWRWSDQHYGELPRVTGGRERLLHDMRARADAPALPEGRDALARARVAPTVRLAAGAVAGCRRRTSGGHRRLDGTKRNVFAVGRGRFLNRSDQDPRLCEATAGPAAEHEDGVPARYVNHLE